MPHSPTIRQASQLCPIPFPGPPPPQQWVKQSIQLMASDNSPHAALLIGTSSLPLGYNLFPSLCPSTVKLSAQKRYTCVALQQCRHTQHTIKAFLQLPGFNYIHVTSKSVLPPQFGRFHLTKNSSQLNLPLCCWLMDTWKHMRVGVKMMHVIMREWDRDINRRRIAECRHERCTRRFSWCMIYSNMQRLMLPQHWCG